MSYFDYIIDEFRQIFKDEGVLLFFIFLPLGYPLLYSWIYNNEVVREVPVAVVDNSHTALSREFISKMDASPDVCVALHCTNMKEAESAIGHGQAYGILYFPSDFGKNIGRLEQSHVGVYSDMSYMLTYKAIYQTATAVSGVMGTELQKKLIGKYTNRDEELNTKPLDFDDVAIFNAPGGYGNFIIPAVLIVIIQQSMLLGVGMLAGTRREQLRNHVKHDSELKESFAPAPVYAMYGRGTAYFLFFAVMLAWITLIVPKIFGFVSMVHGLDLTLFFIPYLMSCVFFSFIVSEFVRYRESVMLVVVFSSILLLFMSGVSWPQNNIPGCWQGVAWLFPSTFAVRGFIRMSSMGALLGDVQTEWIGLWIQVFVYGTIATIVQYLRYKKPERFI